MSGFGTDESFGLKIERFRQLAAGFVANKRAKAAPAAPRAPQARTPMRFGLEPTDISVPKIEDFFDPEDLAAKAVNAGRMSCGELPIPTPAPVGLAVEVLNAAALARAGGRPLPAPSGLAKQILEAGEKRRKPMGT
jgi:hypothetical protein